MLRELRIQNLSVIEDLALQFQTGLTVFTGETGAGKSIIIGAIELLVGGRASLAQLRTGCEEAVLEGVFADYPSHPIVAHLIEMGLLSHSGEDIVIRRLISRTGKSRIYLNGGLIPRSLLQRVGTALVEIHGQHEHQSFLKVEEQRTLLDTFGGLDPDRALYSVHRSHLNDLENEKKRLEEQNQNLDRHLELFHHQRDEIEAARLEEGEEEELLREHQKLSHSDHLARTCSETYDLLFEREGSILSSLSGLNRTMEDLCQIDPELHEIAEQSKQALIHLEETSGALRAYRDRLDIDPDRLESVGMRLQLIRDLKKKYGSTISEVLKFLDGVKHELLLLSSKEDRLREVIQQAVEVRHQMEAVAGKLSQKRVLIGKTLSRKVQNELKSLRMDGTIFKVLIQTSESVDSWRSHGADHVEFLVSPNPGEEAKPLSKVVSGGELSRITLVLKLILGRADRIPTLIFDEVDVGIGGAVAEVVGQRLKSLALDRQIFCITHLPQIAALGDHHVQIRKQLTSKKTKTQAVTIKGKDRVRELARMLGGQELTQRTLQHAEEMLRN